MRALLPTSIILAIFAQVQPTSTSPFNWENLTAQGVLGFVIVWLITRTLPGWQKEFVTLNETFVTATDKALAIVNAAQERFLESQSRLDMQRHEDSENLQRTLTALAANCAEVHGLVAHTTAKEKQ